jgi:hypothetical protein
MPASLQEALRTAFAKLGGLALARPSSVRVTIQGTLDVNGSGGFSRTLGPLLLDVAEMEPVFKAMWARDLRLAGERFEVAFARGYGVDRVTITNVQRLTLEPVGRLGLRG